MPLIQAEIKLPILWRTLTVNLFFPDGQAEGNSHTRGVITLLHGMSNTGLDWMSMTAAPRYAADNGYILVAPEADNSFYLDMRNGPPFYTTLTKLLPQALQTMFNIPREREKNYVAGNSMGGYGAFRFAMMRPNLYAAAGSFSGCLDVGAVLPGLTGGPLTGTAESVIGEDLQLPQEADLFYLAERAAKLPPQQRPRLFQSCGNQDEQPAAILAQNNKFHKHTKSIGLPCAYHLWDGVHEWNFWDRSLAAFISFIQQDDYQSMLSKAWAAPVQFLRQ